MAEAIISGTARAEVLRGLTNARQRSVAPSDRLIEVRCSAVPGRNGHRGSPLIVVRRNGEAPWVGIGSDDPESRWAECRCGTWHLISLTRLNKAVIAARARNRAEPDYIAVADLAPIAI